MVTVKGEIVRRRTWVAADRLRDESNMRSQGRGTEMVRVKGEVVTGRVWVAVKGSRARQAALRVRPFGAHSTSSGQALKPDDLPLGRVLDGQYCELHPGRSLKLRNHSPTGFSWGYGGSGPAQLALAILLHLNPVAVALAAYQAFKWEFVATWPASDFEISLRDEDVILGAPVPGSTP